MWLQQTPELEGWEDRTERVDSLLVSDVEYEVSCYNDQLGIHHQLLTVMHQSAIWKMGIQKMSPDEITRILDETCLDSRKLKELYHVYRDRPASCHYGALDLINDARFALPSYEISEQWRKRAGKVYQCIIDEANPWQASSRAHHAVDLILLFGGVDISFNAGAERAARRLRESWLSFVSGGSPWESSTVYAFGPHGRCGEIDDEEYALRRRVKCFEYLKSLGAMKCREISGKLAVGRVSLLN